MTKSYEQQSGRDRFFQLLEREMETLIDARTGTMRADWAEPVRCYLCHDGGEPRPLFAKQGLSFDRCDRCGLAFMNPRPSRDALEQLYAFESEANDAWVDVLLSDAEEAFQSRDFGELLDMIQGHVPGGRLLDIGCSVGRFLAIARDRGFNVEGLELGARAARHAREEYGLDVREVLFEEAGYETGTLDVVTLIEVLEHLAHPRAMLREIRRVVRPGGLVLIGVPNFASLGVMVLGPKARTFNRNHLIYFNEDTLGQLLHEEGFEVVESRTAVTVLDSIVNEFQRVDPFGPRETRFLPSGLRARLEDPRARDRLERAIYDLGLGYRLRTLARRR